MDYICMQYYAFALTVLHFDVIFIKEASHYYVHTWIYVKTKVHKHQIFFNHTYIGKAARSGFYAFSNFFLQKFAQIRYDFDHSAWSQCALKEFLRQLGKKTVLGEDRYCSL
jgi:hypothetical protein